MAAEKDKDLEDISTSKPRLRLSDIEHLPGPYVQAAKEDSDTRPLTPMETDISIDEYPTGVRLILLVGAVVLSVFLIFLNQMSCILDYL